MTWAQETKNLVAEIKIGHIDRTTKVEEIRGETRDILVEADAYIKKVATELKDAAKDLKDFLAKSEGARKKDFDVMMKGIQAKIKEIKSDVKDFLSKSEETRIVDFKALMKDVTGKVEEIKKSTKNLLGDCKAERKEAAGYWGRLKGKEAVSAEKAEAKKQKKHQNEKEEQEGE